MVAKSDILDFTFFREKGLLLLQKLSGQQWTDHNPHDPGITILEQLCYTLTDLSYRIDFSIPDLMAETGANDWADNFRQGLMLTTGPVNLSDWRRVVIDTEGVRNAWIYPIDTTLDTYNARVFYDLVEGSLRMTPPVRGRDSTRSIDPLKMQGLYRVVFVPEPGKNPENVKIKIQNKLHALRNLGEDFHEIKPLASQGLFIEGKIETGVVSDPAALLASIYFDIQEYLSPRIRFYSLQERLHAGYLLEDILEGPLLNHGFLDDKDLDDFQLRRSVRISDLMRLIMNIDGVVAVKNLKLSLSGTNISASTEKGEPWELIIPDGFSPVLIIPTFPSEKRNPIVGISLLKNGLPLKIDWKISWHWLSKMNEEEAERTKPLRQKMETKAPARGQHRKVREHQSIQHQFPEVFGIGEVGLSSSASTVRMAQARQFKAYLAIFDQLLANSFAQLGGVGKLFSQLPLASKKTYFSQSLRDEIPDFEPLINWKAFELNRGSTNEDNSNNYNKKLQLDTEGGARDPERQRLWDRRNRLLNHLLARFGEGIQEHDAVLKQNLLHQKETLINDYALISQQRGKGFNYMLSSQDPFNVSGLERRLGVLLGFSQSPKKELGNLLKNDPGGFYLIEHILLRPSPSDAGQENSILQIPLPNLDENDRLPLKDPFSLQVSFFFPAWIDRFDNEKNPGFRKAVLKTIREETPAHLRIYINWLSQPEMQKFELTYQNWITLLKDR